MYETFNKASVIYLLVISIYYLSIISVKLVTCVDIACEQALFELSLFKEPVRRLVLIKRIEKKGGAYIYPSIARKLFTLTGCKTSSLLTNLYNHGEIRTAHLLFFITMSYRPIALTSQILRVSSRCSLTISVRVQQPHTA